MKKIYSKNKQAAFYLALGFALLCWMLLFYQFLSAYLIPAKSTIPAFLPVADTKQENSMISYPVSAFSDFSSGKTLDQNTLYRFLKQYDKDVEIISYHTEKNYTDIYFYSPVLQRKNTANSSKPFNLQAAITASKVYFGTPFLQYDF